MPTVLASLLGGLLTIAGSLVGRVMIALGLSVITYGGLTVAIDFAKSKALTAIHGLPVEVVGLLSALGVGQFINIITSALLARLVLNGLTDGTVKKWVMK